MEDKTEDKRSTWAKYGIPTLVGVGVALGAAVTVLSMLSGSENEEGEDKRSTWAKYGIPTLVGVGVALGAAVTVLSMLSGSENEEGEEDKMMRAPGRPGADISRNGFEKDPSSYFRDLRKK